MPGICNLSKSELTHIWAFFFGKSGASKFMASSRRNSGGLLGATEKVRKKGGDQKATLLFLYTDRVIFDRYILLLMGFLLSSRK